MRDEWEEVSILDVAPITSKLVDPKDEKYSSMILIAPDHIQSESGQIIAKATAREQNAISGKYLVKKGDVIYSKIRPYLKKVCIAPEDCLCSADMYPFSCTEQINSKYLQTLLLSKQFTDYANSCSARTGIPKINRDDIALFFCKIPPIPEQEKIAESLSIWDSAIEKTEKLISEKEKLYKGHLNYFYDENENCIKLSEFSKETSQRNKGKKLTQVLSVTNKNGFVPPEQQFGKKIASEDLSNYKIIEKGQFAYNPSRINVGSIARLDDFDSAVLSPMYTVFEINTNLINSDYFLHWLSSKYAIHQIKLCAQGGVREIVGFEDFKKMKIKSVSLEKQEKISDFLNIEKSEISLLKKQLEQYKLQKQGLMQKLLTGEWRVK